MHAHNASLRLTADKSVHLGLFFILAMLLWNAVAAAPRSRLAIVLLAGLLVGAISEYFQSWFPGRDSSIRDVVINFASAATAGVLRLPILRGRPEGPGRAARNSGSPVRPRSWLLK